MYTYCLAVSLLCTNYQQPTGGWWLTVNSRAGQTAGETNVFATLALPIRRRRNLVKMYYTFWYH